LNAPSLKSQKLTNSGPIPGLHIVANFKTATSTKLLRYEAFRDFIVKEVQDSKLCQVGEVFHNFDNGGYTAVVCLTESHLSIHTWPENNYITFDIFLSNYLKDNRSVTQNLYDRVKEYFSAVVLFEQIIER
jgi:S-adenosylmethionine decarboxylase